MSLTRYAAPTLVASLAVSGLAVPQAHAYNVDVDEEAATCTIEFTDTERSNVNGAYNKLFLRMAAEVRDSFTGEQAKKDAEIVYNYGVRDDVDNAANLHITEGFEISNAQTRLALGPEKGKYYRMVAYLNASKRPVVEDTTIEMTQEEAYNKGGLTYGVDFGTIIGGTVGGLILGDQIGDVREAILNAAKEYAPEFAGPIFTYNEVFTKCADGESGSGSIAPGSALTSSQAKDIGIAAAVLGILSLIGIGFALRPTIDQFIAQFQR